MSDRARARIVARFEKARWERVRAQRIALQALIEQDRRTAEQKS